MKRILWVVFFLNIASTCYGYAKAENPPASAIASASKLATDAGFGILAQGGNAFDAAVAVAATLAVVEPYGSGMGGGGFWLIHTTQPNKNLFIDGREVAPLASTAHLYNNKKPGESTLDSINGALAAGIPGEPASLVYISKHFGKLPLATCLQPAIDYAQNGFRVNLHYRKNVKKRLKALQASKAASAIFLDNNKIPFLGHKIIQKDLAKTLQAVAQNGNAGFYQGTVAKQLVSAVRAGGGIWQLQDLKLYKIKVHQPLTTEYQGYRIVTSPLPSAGGIGIITALNILRNFDFTELTETQRKHIIVETLRRIYRDRSEYLGDSDFIQIPSFLTSQNYANKLKKSIHLDKATASKSLQGPKVRIREGYHTTHFSILDQQGNRVAATLSINYPFGSGFVAGTTGVLLNNEMDDFSIADGTPNIYGLVGGKRNANGIAPGKRPLSSMTPTFVENKDRVAIIGAPGGGRIVSMILLNILQIINGESPKNWVTRPRFHHQYLPDVIEFELNAFSEHERQALMELGHELKQLDEPYGNAQVILWNRKTRSVLAASDPRGIGSSTVKQVRQ